MYNIARFQMPAQMQRRWKVGPYRTESRSRPRHAVTEGEYLYGKGGWCGLQAAIVRTMDIGGDKELP